MADASRLPEGIVIEGSLLIARPIGTIVRDEITGGLYASTNATVATYVQLAASPAQLRYTPSTEWFGSPVSKDVSLAPIPGTLDADAAADYAPLNVPFTSVISAIHLHMIRDGNAGQYDLEVFRQDNPFGVPTYQRIATATLANGGGNFTATSFTFLDPAFATVTAPAYLFLQATAKMGGTPIGRVDVHFSTVAIGAGGELPP